MDASAINSAEPSKKTLSNDKATPAGVELSPNFGDGRAGQAAAVAG
jgi:hypothetical protein